MELILSVCVCLSVCVPVRVCVQVVMQHLREQVKDLQSTKDALAVSKLREDALQDQVSAPQPH